MVNRVGLNKLPQTTVDSKPQITVSFELIGSERISVHTVPYNPTLDNILRQQFHGTHESNHKGLIYTLSQQDSIVNSIEEYAIKSNTKIKCDTIDSDVVKLLQADRKQYISLLNTMSTDHVDDLIDLTSESICNPDDLLHSQSPVKQSINSLNHKKPRKIKKARGALSNQYDIEPLFDSTRIPNDLWNRLMDFQRDGVAYGVNHLGRCHISDDMGLGKTIQAITIAYYYRTDWPLLIVCPSSVRLNWQNELSEWLVENIRDKSQCINMDKVDVIMSSKDTISTGAEIVIISYDLLNRMTDQLCDFNFNFVICDESHYIKSAQAKRTQCVVPLIKQSKRALLLSGTPALNRPGELYTQIDCLLPGLLPKYKEFGIRYCDGRDGRFGFEMKGGTHLIELYQLLTRHVMIRREKSTVLHQLPAKRRQQIIIDVPNGSKIKKKLLKGKSDTHNIEKLLAMAINNESNDNLNISQSTLFTLFKESGKSKLPGICDYISVLINSEVKFIIFAHHLDVLNGIELCVKHHNIDYMRIDGSTKPEQRQYNVNKFQTDDNCRVAILSIQAAGAGITLHASSTVIFAELVWSPKILEQAEDRVHRIGQRDTCNIHYLIGRGTIDDDVWPIIKRKFDMLGNALSESYQVNQRNAFDMNTVDRPDDTQQKQLHYFPQANKLTLTASSSQHNNYTTPIKSDDAHSQSLAPNSTEPSTPYSSMPALEPDDDIDDKPIAYKYGSHVLSINSDDEDIPIAKKIKCEPLSQPITNNHCNSTSNLSDDVIDLLD